MSESTLNTSDAAADVFDGRMRPGAAAADAPLRRADGEPTWLLRELSDGFTLLFYGDATAARDLHGSVDGRVPIALLTINATQADAATLVDEQGLLARRYDLQPGNAVLLRPDQHVCARWRQPTAAALRAALHTALALA